MKKSTILLITGAVICLVLSFVSASYSVTRTENAIADIGTVTYEEECRARIDRAQEYYDALDVNLGLDERITNEDEFINAKTEYVRLAIKAAVVADERKAAEGYSDADVQAFVTEARELADTYLSDDQCQFVGNFSDLTELEAIYSDDGGGSDSEESTEEEESVPLC